LLLVPEIFLSCNGKGLPLPSGTVMAKMCFCDVFSFFQVWCRRNVAE